MHLWRLVCCTLLLSALAISAGAQNPIVVELFTSEGCSSCPPADAVLMKLSEQGRSDLILLGEHVDYWNYIGWTDRFSSAQFSHRQGEYGQALHSETYTPQMVIDGKVQFVGSDAGEVQRRIAAAAADPKPASVTLKWEGDRLDIHSETPVGCRIMLAITEDGLSTSVNAGENGGRTLHHAAVVRSLQDIDEPDKGVYDAAVKVPSRSEWNAAKLRVAVIVQDKQTMRVLGAASVPYRH